jgi:hypothetical protein
MSRRQFLASSAGMAAGLAAMNEVFGPVFAFRKLEIPLAMQEQYGFTPLGPADDPAKTAILGGNAARLYKLAVPRRLGAISADTISAMKHAYRKMGGMRCNTRYGYVYRDT